MNELNELSSAMFNTSFPCNPNPFLNGLKEGIKANGMDWIKSDQAKKILYVLIAQSHGQAFNIDSFTEYTNLNK